MLICADHLLKPQLPLKVSMVSSMRRVSPPNSQTLKSWAQRSAKTWWRTPLLHYVTLAERANPTFYIYIQYICPFLIFNILWFLGFTCCWIQSYEFRPEFMIIVLLPSQTLHSLPIAASPMKQEMAKQHKDFEKLQKQAGDTGIAPWQHPLTWQWQWHENEGKRCSNSNAELWRRPEERQYTWQKSFVICKIL